MRLTGPTRLIAAATLAAAAFMSTTGAAWAEPVTEDFQTSSGAIGPGSYKTVTLKCPSTLPYIVSFGASTQIDSDEDELHTHVVDVKANEANRSISVSFTNSEPKNTWPPVDVSVKLHVSCSNVKPAQPPSLHVTKNVTVPILGTFSAFVLCPVSHPRLVETHEGHDAALTRTKLNSFPGNVGGGATWENNDGFAPHPAWVRVYCTA
ncbi:hypothetical protein [Nonomuraea gerenzanensis]|uniref:Secreted protein n=1 Tax=Nonomuraea gerenzanensis TaxID=93944 RepID=A0A1M4E8R4_9ACTN|nr:hypothetical protein [Nonomuraea gerenzanensis]UBU17401.1 hypothetical protein LCN96_20960 [Nonomuraea gerenzanensis]SBO95154.1 hypothetical protein BN4615_P4670 [Nonomuraea gerenzanensis]